MRTPAGALASALDSFSSQPDDSTLTIKVVQGTYPVGAALGAHWHSAYPDSVGLQLLDDLPVEEIQRPFLGSFRTKGHRYRIPFAVPVRATIRLREAIRNGQRPAYRFMT